MFNQIEIPENSPDDKWYWACGFRAGNPYKRLNGYENKTHTSTVLYPAGGVSMRKSPHKDTPTKLAL